MQVSLVVSEPSITIARSSTPVAYNREAYAVRLLDVERCLRPQRSVPPLPDNRLLDPLSRSSIMEEPMFNKSAPFHLTRRPPPPPMRPSMFKRIWSRTSPESAPR